MYHFTLQRARFTVGVGRSQSDTRNARCAKFNATEENYDFVLGVAEIVRSASGRGWKFIHPREGVYEIWNTLSELE